MRVIAGKYRSIQLKAPKGTETRPTQDRIKETLFNIIQKDVPEAVFVDLYSGSGGIGIEALSRGALKVYFIDNATDAVNCINENLCKIHTDKAVVIKADVLSALSRINEKEVDIIFIDPPYNNENESVLFDFFKGLKYITENTIIILEAKIGRTFDFTGFEVIRVKEYKTNQHVFFRRIYE